MQFEHLKIFLAVAEYRSFTKAAQALYISHSTTSRSVSALEAELGVQLLIRDGRSVRLTQAGELLRKEGSYLIRKTELVETAVRNTGKGTQGQLSISAAPVYSRLVSGACLDFCRAYPKVALELYSRSAAEVVDVVLTGGTDLGVSFSYLLPEQNEALKTRSISGEKFCVVVPIDHALAARRTVQPEELSLERLILIAPGQPECGFLTGSVGDVHLAPTAESMFLQVRSGNGISVAPYPLAYEYGSGCALLELSGVDTSFDMVLLWHKDNANPSLKLFLDSLPDTDNAG